MNVNRIALTMINNTRNNTTITGRKPQIMTLTLLQKIPIINSVDFSDLC